MKVLFVHNRYQQAGGEGRAVAAERAALSEAGIEVPLLARDNAEIRSFRDAARVGWALPGTERLRRQLREEIADHRPDLVHAHNIFPLITPALYEAAADLGVPVVQTLHNYRNICANSLLMRDGRVCEDCVAGSPYQAVLHRCYRGSALASLAVARMIDVHRRRGTWAHAVARYIALSAFSKSRFVAAGFPAERIAVKPNSPGSDFVEPPAAGNARRGALFVGRLAPEKGIVELLDAWLPAWGPLKVIGDGPLMPALAAAVADGRAVAFGTLPRERIAAEMRRAAFCLIPSRCYENFPMALAEAYASGLPVLASRLGALAELVDPDVTGDLFDPDRPEEMRAVIARAFADPDRLASMGRAARAVYEARLAPEITGAFQIRLYEEVLTARRMRDG